MALALYRKYRPQTFKEITDQNHVKIILEQEVLQGRVAHAYLFSGPRGVGKTSLARILAKAVNCFRRQRTEDKGRIGGEPCNACEACAEITAGRSLDVIEIDAASYTGVDTVRETIIETAKFAPSRLKSKIFIIDEVHMLSTSAWNALLKIMEEPPAHVIFILATTEVHKVPATILSRCQRFDFHRIRPQDLVERLKFIASQEKIRVATPVLQTVARLSEGCVRDAESILEQLLSLGEKEITEDVASVVLPRSSTPAVLDFMEVIWLGNVKRGLELISRYLEDGFDLGQFTGDLLELLRKVLIIKTGGVEAIAPTVDGPTLERLQKFADQASTERVLFVIEMFVRARQGLKGAIIPQLPLELAVVEIGGVGGHDARSVSATLLPRAAVAERVGEVEDEGSTSAADASENDSSHPDMPQAQAPILLAELKSQWPEVLKGAQKENHSLPFILHTSEPVAVNGNIVQIGVHYPLYCNKINEPKTQALLDKILSEQFNVPLRAQGVILQRRPAADDDAVEDILNTLGGRVVE
ncbi:MAG: polymerase III, subunit gamma and tau protein [Parcubacteria group bacterium GW2011_GWA2_47_26]|nr:MAG: polymerase III, subunit gamma and tau protein [Parcubacteria group bacterium GW2011_GWA2_47_26]